MGNYNSGYTESTTFSTGIYSADGDLVAYGRSESKKQKAAHEPFTYLYDGGMDWIKRTKSAITIKVFHGLAGRLKYGSPYVSLSSSERRKFREEYGGFSDPMMTGALDELEEAGVILRGKIVDLYTGEILHHFGRGEMMLNPSIVWKGKAKDRKKAVIAFNKLICNGVKNKTNKTQTVDVPTEWHNRESTPIPLFSSSIQNI